MDVFSTEKASEPKSKPERPPMYVDAAPKVFHAERDYKGAHYDHLSNFINGVRSGNQVAEDAVFGYRAAAPALLCNDSYFGDRIIHWDPESMKVV